MFPRLHYTWSSCTCTASMVWVSHKTVWEVTFHLLSSRLLLLSQCYCRINLKPMVNYDNRRHSNSWDLI